MSENKSIDKCLKFIILGDKNVGKSSFLKKYLTDIFDVKYDPTIGTNTEHCYYSYDNKNIKSQIVEIAGQEKYRMIDDVVFRGINGIILMFDLSENESFINVKDWLKDIDKYRNNVPIVLVGNKCDIAVDSSMDNVYSLFSEQNECKYIKISIKNNVNLDQIFYYLMENM